MGAAKDRGAIASETYEQLKERAQGMCEAFYPVKIQGQWFVRRCRSRLRVEAHHMKYRSRGGTGQLVNLVMICKGCHLRAHDQTDVWYARYRTSSHQDEGDSEKSSWGSLEYLTKSMDGFGPVVERMRLLSNKRFPILLMICQGCGFVDFAVDFGDLAVRCRNCKTLDVATLDVSTEAYDEPEQGVSSR